MSTLRIVQNQPDGLGQFRLRFDQPAQDHTHAGQFLTLHIPGHRPAFFAIASSPGEPLELLVKDEGDAAHDLVSLPILTDVEVSEAMGDGFGLDESDRRPLILLAGGSGISAIRPVIEVEIARGLPRPVTLLYGVRTAQHAAYMDRWEAWRSAGVDARLVVSRGTPSWRGICGYVQDAAVDLGLVSAGQVVAVCGVREMQDQARAAWVAAGADASQVRVNW